MPKSAFKFTFRLGTIRADQQEMIVKTEWLTDAVKIFEKAYPKALKVEISRVQGNA